MLKAPEKDTRYLTIERKNGKNGMGIIRLPKPNKTGFWRATIIWTVDPFDHGWEHVSVCPINGKTPTWDDMCFVRDMFWEPEDTVVQFHPPKSEYVNIMDNCLHLWRPADGDIRTPI